MSKVKEKSSLFFYNIFACMSAMISRFEQAFIFLIEPITDYVFDQGTNKSHNVLTVIDIRQVTTMITT